MKKPPRQSTNKRFPIAVLALCIATFSSAAMAFQPDGGISDLQNIATGKIIGLGNTPEPNAVLPRPGLDNASALDALLKAPMTAEVAVRIALMNNPELQEFLGSTGVNLSDVTLKNNPAKSKVREEITLLSAHAYKAWINAVAAAQTARYIQDVKEAAEASGEMARRMAQVGNQSKLMQARAQAELSEAAIQLAKALQLAFSAREELIVTLGLWGEQTEFILPTSLPELPAQALDLPHIEAMVLRERMDLALARYEWQLKLAKGPRPVDADGLWDYMGESAKVRALAVKTRSEARNAYNTYRVAYDVARHMQSEVVPLRKFINDEMVLRYNGMLASIFDVLADSRVQVLGVSSALEAQRDFWLAHADLQALLAGVSLSGLNGGTAAADTPKAR